MCTLEFTHELRALSKFEVGDELPPATFEEHV